MQTRVGPRRSCDLSVIEWSVIRLVSIHRELADSKAAADIQVGLTPRPNAPAAGYYLCIDILTGKLVWGRHQIP